MSNRPDITKKLSLSLEKHLNPKNDTRIYMAKECTFDYATGVSKRVDYCQFKPINTSVSGIEKGDFYCYEIKSSVEDFHSPNGHNFWGIITIMLCLKMYICWFRKKFLLELVYISLMGLIKVAGIT